MSEGARYAEERATARERAKVSEEIRIAQNRMLEEMQAPVTSRADRALRWLIPDCSFCAFVRGFLIGGALGAGVAALVFFF